MCGEKICFMCINPDIRAKQREHPWGKLLVISYSLLVFPNIGIHLR